MTYNARICEFDVKYSAKNKCVKFYEILKITLMMFEKHANLKYKLGKRRFWAGKYYVLTVGLNESSIRNHVQELEKSDFAMDKA